MKYLLLLIFISCTHTEIKYIPKYIPREVATNDTLSKLVNSARVDKGLNSLVSEKLLIELSREKAILMQS